MILIFISESTPSMPDIAIAMVAGYIIKVAEEQTSCEGCLEQISSPATDSPTLSLIRFQDRGGLRYPKSHFVALLKTVTNFVTAAIHYLPRKNLLHNFKTFLLEKFSSCIKCKLCNDEKLPTLLLEKFLKPLLDNIARNQTQKCEKVIKLFKKPLCRKVKKIG